MDQNVLKKIAENSRDNFIELVTNKLQTLKQKAQENEISLDDKEREIGKLIKDSKDLTTVSEQLATFLFNSLNSIYFLNRAGLLSASIYSKETFLKNINVLVESHLFDQLSLPLLSYFLDSKAFKDDGVFFNLFSELDCLKLSKEELPQALSWLYQNFNTKRKDEIFRNLKKNTKITDQTLTSATLIYTPEWIVKYLVENSLGRIWINHLCLINPEKTEDDLIQKFNLKYYLKEDENLDKEAISYYRDLELEELTFIDPAMGSGNILLYAFELFIKFYEFEGITKEEAVNKILTHNLFGLDIDTEALRLTRIALAIKGETLKIPGSNILVFNDLEPLNLGDLPAAQSISVFDQIALFPELQAELDSFKNGKLLGSLIDVSGENLNKKEALLQDYIKNPKTQEKSKKTLIALKKLLFLMGRKYDVVVTNPPYFGSKYLNKDLQEYIKSNYYYKHQDLYSAFIEKALRMTKDYGFAALIVQPSFLTTTAFSDFRKDIITGNSILSLLDIGRGIFGYDFGSTAFVIRKEGKSNYSGKYFKLRDRVFKYIPLEVYEKIYLKSMDNPKLRFIFDENYSRVQEEGSQVFFKKNQRSFLKFPKISIAYWTSDQFDKHMNSGESLGDYFNVRQGLATTDNNRFLRYWYEVDFEKIKFDTISKEEALESGYKWFPYNKGGAYRKWYGNDEYVINWEDDGKEIKESVLKKYPYLKNPGFVIKNPQFYFKPSVTWSLVSSDEASFRMKDSGYLFDVGGMSMFSEDSDDLYYLLGLSNSVVSRAFLEVINPTINYQCGDIAQIPYIESKDYRDEVTSLVKENIFLSRKDWDEDELSWDYKTPPLVGKKGNLKVLFDEFLEEKKKEFNQLKKNEERLNDIFIKLYGLNELSPKVSETKVSIHLPDESEIVKSLLSFFVGTLFDRYNLEGFRALEVPGVFISNTDLENFDIISELKRFLVTAFGEEDLEENLDFIAGNLQVRNRKKSSEMIRNYFYKYFSQNHYKKYNKRPIYWEFGSTSSSIKILVPYHLIDRDLIGKIREEGLKLKESIKEKHNLVNTQKETKELERVLSDLTLLIDNLSEIENNTELHHDDGIRANYEKIQNLAKDSKNLILKRI